MHLYRSNINLKIDIPYSLPSPYIKLSNFECFPFGEVWFCLCYLLNAKKDRIMSVSTCVN